jgi:hypothetical protein
MHAPARWSWSLGRSRGSAVALSMPVARVQATVAPSPKGAVMKCLLEILNDEAW